ncbi:MAG: hypothetical protein M3Y57_04950, partial [Acidobacteriota bacterium]|nr:hypothetical protein [Acidobacteriota bacterium]
MSLRMDTLSRAQLIGGLIASGALAACGAKSTTPSGSMCALGVDESIVNEIFSDKVFNGLDKKALLAAFDPSPNIDALHQGYLAQVGQQPQNTGVIMQIPSEGVVIQSPGTYRFGRDILWTPDNVTSSAITIRCSNVTLDLAGFTLTASVSDKSQRTAGILVEGPVEDITVTNGTVANLTEYGILARSVCNLSISRITATGLCMENIVIRNLTPTGIHVSTAHDVAISECSVTHSNVTTDSSAGIQLMKTLEAKVSDCSTSDLVNNDGAVQGFSSIVCANVTTTGCTAKTLQSFYNGNDKTSGHTVLGFVPIFCNNLSYLNCSASGLTGCCDDCHGMSVFLDAKVLVSGFHASNVKDGSVHYNGKNVATNSGAKATGLEVYGAGVTVMDSTVNDISAINPGDLQAAGFSAWGALIQF